MKKLFLIGTFILFSYTNAQIGIRTIEPTNTLDVNGTFRVRDVPISVNTSDYNIVIDDKGEMKKNISSTKGVLRAYLSSKFITGKSSSTIYKIINWNILDNPDGSFNESTGIFTVPLKGLYRINYTATIQAISDTGILENANAVVGIVNNSTNKWITQFIIAQINRTLSTVGEAYSFIGVVQLEKGEDIYFGITGYNWILSNPSGATGGGIGTFFELKLIKEL